MHECKSLAHTNQHEPWKLYATMRWIKDNDQIDRQQLGQENTGQTTRNESR